VQQQQHRASAPGGFPAATSTPWGGVGRPATLPAGGGQHYGGSNSGSGNSNPFRSSSMPGTYPGSGNPFAAGNASPLTSTPGSSGAYVDASAASFRGGALPQAWAVPQQQQYQPQHYQQQAPHYPYVSSSDTAPQRDTASSSGGGSSPGIPAGHAGAGAGAASYPAISPGDRHVADEAGAWAAAKQQQQQQQFPDISLSKDVGVAPPQPPPMMRPPPPAARPVAPGQAPGKDGRSGVC
jgi:hypothetical protein